MRVLLALGSLSLVGCTTIAEVAVDEAKSDEPTPYEEKGGLFSKYGFGEELLSDGSYKVWFHGNALTAPERVRDVVTLRSAEIGRDNGRTHFTLSRGADNWGTIACQGKYDGLYISSIQVSLEQVVTYGTPEDLSGDILSVSEVLQRLSDSVRTVSTSEADEQRIYTSNRLSCVNEKRFMPEEVETYQELIDNGVFPAS